LFKWTCTSSTGLSRLQGSVFYNILVAFCAERVSHSENKYFQPLLFVMDAEIKKGKKTQEGRKLFAFCLKHWGNVVLQIIYLQKIYIQFLIETLLNILFLRNIIAKFQSICKPFPQPRVCCKYLVGKPKHILKCDHYLMAVKSDPY